MTQLEVLRTIEPVATAKGLDKHLILAICQQESSFKSDVSRLENGFYKRYTEPDSLATTTEVLLAVSYGLMQTMGQALRERGYFVWYLTYYNARHTMQLKDPLSEIAVPKAINEYMVRPPWQIEWGCEHFITKLKAAKGDVEKALLFWNGGGNPNYPKEVLAKYDILKKFEGD